ncbi:dihydrodipicolinate synthase family protein [Falsirhodobacter sp. 1013]|uniref:dihydrodipicolinate synthase family protein n=1 Tax=Falsirhodobacter sp. 1013 TaxID=3417566 RepID=UPI003EB8A73E
MPFGSRASLKRVLNTLETASRLQAPENWRPCDIVRRAMICIVSSWPFTGPSAFPLTPMDREGRLLPDVLERHLERIVEAGSASVGLLGSTGSYAYPITAERKDVVRVAATVLAGRIPLIAGAPGRFGLTRRWTLPDTRPRRGHGGSCSHRCPTRI